MNNPLYRRVDDDHDDDHDDGHRRGRHLVANTPIEKGRLIFCERPLLALQTLENQKYVSICHCCKAFLGGPDYALKHPTSAAKSRREEDQSQQQSTREYQGADTSDYASPSFQVVPCRLACGHLYCSLDCEADAWQVFHSHLCTGQCREESSPLVRFKQLAVQTNEILLLVAEWWVAQHTLQQQESGDDDDETQSQSSPYTDFCMEPWWDVAILDLQKEPGGFAQAATLQASLRQICQDAADLLTQVFAESTLKKRIPPISALDIAKRIGACEQNAMGIRQRNPLCRSVLEDADLRQRCHDEIVASLAESGFIGQDDDEDGDDDEEDEPEGNDSNSPVVNGKAETAEQSNEKQIEENEECWDYSVDEIASFLAGLFIDEEGTVRDEAQNNSNGGDENNGGDRERDMVGDDLDYIFLPLDGTAMYATACKMNHSCDPNVIVMYRSKKKWGSKYPLTAYCLALRDIAADEELTISYIDINNVPYDQRRQALANYGFDCACTKCKKEKNGEGAETPRESQQVTVDDRDDDLFGGDGEEDLFGGDEDDDQEDENKASGNAGEKDEIDGDMALQQRLERLDTAMNHTRYASIPLTMHGRVAAFVIRAAKWVLSSSDLSDKVVLNLLQQCSGGLQARDYSLCKTVGCDLEETLYSLLRKDSAWPSVHYREAYWCAALTAAVGYSHDCSFLKAQNVLDKVVILGLSIKSEPGLKELMQYVECHATETSVGPYPPCIACMIPNYRDSSLIEQLSNEALSRPICHPIHEISANEITVESFHSDFVPKSAPLVFRSLAIEWPALRRWRDLQSLARYYGHRFVPVELGSMMTGEMVEELTTFRDFIQSFLAPSAAKSCWSLNDAVSRSQKVAYLAQHPLLDQMSSLRSDVNMKPALCGADGPTHVYMWLGTGGTRTPLHFDSYDNLFVQIAGAKYVRIYKREETPNLYVSTKSAYGLQGNMSELDCECEDFVQHPLAKDAAYEEVLLLPGDALFIPSRTWHYVRSLSTSASINFWF